MKSRSFFLTLLFGNLLILISCNSNNKNNSVEKNVLGNKIDTAKKQDKSVSPSDSCKYYLRLSQELDSVLLKSTQFDEKLAIRANNTFVKCAFECHHDSISALYLLKAAQLSQSLNKLELSEKYLTKILSDYPNTKFKPAAKFLLAQYYADVKLLNKPSKAKELFNQIIKEYPKSIWAENAAAALQWVGKSDEEILKELKKKK